MNQYDIFFPEVDMDLESWIRKNSMETNQFVKLIGCSRTLIWRAKKGEAISPKFAAKIYEITNGQVIIKTEKVGRKPYGHLNIDKASVRR